jgi:hypothetical protein
MLERLGRGLTFVVGSVVGGLALAFLIVAVRPDLIRRTVAPSLPLPVASQPALPAPSRVTYAAAVQLAAPSVVNIYTQRLGSCAVISYPATETGSSAASDPASSSTRPATWSPMITSSPTPTRSGSSSKTAASPKRTSSAATPTRTSRS